MSAVFTWRECGGSWVPLLASPSTNPGFREAARYQFAVPDGTLFVDDEPLQRSEEGVAEWSPRFFAGEVTAEFVPRGGGATTVFLLDVSPDDRKLGRDIFQRMIAELWEEDPRLILGSEPSTNLVGTSGELADPWLAFARLRRYAPAFLQGLSQVRLHPRRTLRVTRTTVAPAAVRRVDRTTATTLFRSSAVALLVDRDTDVDLGGIRLDVPVSEETLDSAANRCLAALTRAVGLRARQLLDTLEREVAREQESETRTSLAARWPLRRGQLLALASQLARALRTSPFDKVSRAEITGAGLTAIAADPVYARAWTSGWRAVRDGVDGSPDRERMWVSPTWELYERWCFVAVRRWLALRFPAETWKRRHDGYLWTASSRGTHIELALQPTFPAWSENRGERWSVSRQREPDIVLTVTKDAVSRFVVFDAKYRASRQNVLEAMQSAHIYQDSLRICGERPVGALLLVPAGGGAPWLERAEFQDEHRVGIVEMTPGREPVMPAFMFDLVQGPNHSPEGVPDVLG